MEANRQRHQRFLFACIGEGTTQRHGIEGEFVERRRKRRQLRRRCRIGCGDDVAVEIRQPQRSHQGHQVGARPQRLRCIAAGHPQATLVQLGAHRKQPLFRATQSAIDLIGQCEREQAKFPGLAFHGVALEVPQRERRHRREQRPQRQRDQPRFPGVGHTQACGQLCSPQSRCRFRLDDI
jgi:hypothetical protein